MYKGPSRNNSTTTTSHKYYRLGNMPIGNQLMGNLPMDNTSNCNLGVAMGMGNEC